MSRLIVFLSAITLSLPCIAGDGVMSQLLKIAEPVVLAHAQAQDAHQALVCSKMVWPKSDSTRVSQLLATVHNVGLHDELGYTPANYAVMVDNTYQLNRLLDMGYSTSGPVGSLLFDAAASDSPDAVRVLLRRGVDPNPKGQGDVLVTAIANGSQDVVRILLKHGAKPSVRALWSALACKDQSMVDLLVGYGVTIDANARKLAKKYNIKLQ